MTGTGTVKSTSALFLLVIFLSSLLVTCDSARAQEPAEDFLNALRGAGYYDEALEYLDDMAADDLITEEFRRILPFEKAETLIASAAKSTDLDVLEDRLNQAEGLLTEYASQATEAQEIATTMRYRGSLCEGRAKLFRSRSESDRLTAAEKETLVAKVRSSLENAGQAYADARASMRTAIENYIIDPADPSTIQGRKRLHAYYTTIRLRQPVVREQLADTYPEGDAKRKELLESSAAEYIDLYDDYGRDFLAGLKSKLYAARCFYKLGKTDDAILHVKPLLSLGDNAAIKDIKKDALVLACDCWKAKDPYPFDEIVDTAGPVVKTLTRIEKRKPDWLKVQLELAKASQAKAMQLKEDDAPAKEVSEMKVQANKLIRNVARSKTLRDEANGLMESWNLNPEDIVDTIVEQPRTFADAVIVCQDQIADIETVIRSRSNAKRGILQATGDADRQAVMAELEDLQSQIDEKTTNALGTLDLALSFSDSETERVDLNKVRYFQTFCHFASNRFLESAVIGQFMVNRYPQVNFSRQAGALAVQSYEAILRETPEADRAFDLEQLGELCTMMLDRWPGSDEAGKAASTMCRNSLVSGNIRDAEKYYALIPASYSARGSLALNLGQHSWARYSKEKDTLSAEESATVLQNAKQFLQAGISSVDPSGVTYPQAVSARFLVGALLASGETDTAIKQLEEGPAAPLRLVTGKNPIVMNNPGKDVFIRETYKSAINAYLEKLREGGDQKTWIDKANGVIAAMREQAATSPEGAAHLATTYRIIGRELKQQFDALPTPDEKIKFAKVLSAFLSAIARDATEAKTVLWSGRSMLDVARSLSNAGLDAGAGPMFEQAVEALNRAESLGLTNDPQLKWQKALSLQGSGQYELAVEQLVEVLTTANSLDVQFDAAETLHKWAASSSQARKYAEAWGGSHQFEDPGTRRKQNRIWGWKRIAGYTSDKPDHLDMYIKATYFTIEARLEYGLLENNAKAIASASRDFDKFRARQPAVSEGKYKERWDALGSRIQAATN